MVLFRSSKLWIPTKRSSQPSSRRSSPLAEVGVNGLFSTLLGRLEFSAASLSPSFFPSRGQESSLSLSLAVYFSFPRCGMLQHLNFKNKRIDFYLEFLFVFFLTRELKKNLISSTPIEIVLHRQRGMQNAHLQYGLVIVAGKQKWSQYYHQSSLRWSQWATEEV